MPIAALLHSDFAHAKFPPEDPDRPETHLVTIRSAHFLVHFPVSYQHFTEVLLGHLEEAYDVLSRDLGWELGSPADIVVSSDTDTPNGFTQVFPFNRIVIEAVPFQQFSDIGEYDDWIRTLAFHELTHLIANDTTLGWLKGARTVLGSSAKVNQYQPVWLVEGLAVYEETARSRYGRGRSAFFDMLARGAAQGRYLNSRDALLGVTLDRLNEGVPFFPGPQTPYLYGYLLEELLADEAGPAALGEVSRRSARSLPFLVNRILRQVAATDYGALWRTLVERANAWVAQDEKRIAARGPLTPLQWQRTGYGRLSAGPVFSEDGKTVYLIRDSYRDGQGISAFALESGKHRDLSDWRYPGGTALRRAGEWLVYSRTDLSAQFNLHSDLFAFDPARGREVQLTHGARALDPDVTPDFKLDGGHVVAGKAVYVKNLADANQALVLWDGRQERVLVQGQEFERFSAPVFGRGKSEGYVIFSDRPNGGPAGGVESLQAVRWSEPEGASPGALPGTRIALLLDDGAAAAHRISRVTPFFEPDGSLLYVSSPDGIYDLYRVRDFTPEARAQKAERLTHTDGGLWFPTRSPQGKLYAMGFTPQGFELAHVPEGLAALSTASSPAPDSGVPALQEKARARFTPPAVASPAPVSSPAPGLTASPQKTAEYSVFPAVLPHYWAPYANNVPDGWLLGVRTSGSDALEIHRYELDLGLDTRASFPTYLIRYDYDGLYPTIELVNRQDNHYLGTQYGISNRIGETDLSLIYPIGLWNLSFCGTILDSHLYDQSAQSGGLHVTLGHNDLLRYPSSIDPAGEKGNRLELTMSGYFTGQEQYSYLNGYFEQRLPLLWPEHFARLIASGAASTNRTITPLYFVGGGESSISLAPQNYLLRGYPSGEIFGRRIFTGNFEYWLPLHDIFHGAGVLPAFYERAKLVLFLDTGSGENVAGDAQAAFRAWPVGTGIHLLQDLTLFYRVPVTLSVGFDWGASASLGGEREWVVGLSGQLY